VSISDTIKILGVTFDQNLKWSNHISDLIPKLKRINSVFHHLKKYFSVTECLKIATSIYYSKMYYASCVWLLPSLSNQLHSKLLSISSLILKTIFNRKCNESDPISFFDLHKLAKRATPKMYMNYSIAINLHKICENQSPENIWIDLNIQHQNQERNYTPKFAKTNVHKVGINKFSNRVQTVCNAFKTDFLSTNYTRHKVLSKKMFLSF